MASPRSRGGALHWTARLVTVLVACSPVTVRATTMVPLGPRELVAASLAAVRGRVARTAVARDSGTGQTWTEVTIDPTEYLFGTLPPGPIVLRELGGRVDGIEQRVFGGPEYRSGEDVVVFVSSDRRGRLHTTGLGMGAYRIDDTLGRARAVRAFGAEVAVLDPGRGTLVHGVPDDVADLAALRRTVDEAARLAGKRGAHSVRSAGQLSLRIPPAAPTAAFVLLNPAARWFEPDDGLPIRYLIDANGDATLGPTLSRDAVAAGLAQWSSVAAASITLEDGGNTQPVPLGSCPDATRIMFNDPFGELDAPTDCKGVLGITIICDEDETRVVNGKPFRRIFGTKTLINDGFGTCPFWNACSLAEVLTHELGHTVGLGHSQLPAATMAARAHFDGRCASLTVDDENGLASIYPLRPSPSPTPSATPLSESTPTTTATATVTATRPTATITRTGTNTRIPSRTSTPSYTVRPSRTVTPTWTPLPTRTTTPSISPTRSATASPSATPSVTATPSASPSASASLTATASPTASVSSTPTLTRSFTATATLMPPATTTATETATATASPTPATRPSDRLAALIMALRRLLAMLAQSS